MKIPTPAIPDSLHVDLEGTDVVTVSRRQDALIQCAMIGTHRRVMESTLGRPVTELEAAQDWSAKGYAMAYRKHYRVS